MTKIDRITSKLTSIRAMSVILLVFTLCMCMIVFAIRVSIDGQLDSNAKDFANILLGLFGGVVGQVVNAYFQRNDRKEEKPKEESK